MIVLVAAERQMHSESNGQAAIPSSSVAGWREYEKILKGNVLAILR